MKLSFLAGTATATLLSGVANAATPADWRSQSIYFLLTDRFARADNSTTATCNTEDRIYCGGSWQGIINQLDYIQGMGFTAIWISPVTEQLPQNTSDGSSYHGYWQQNIYELNDKFGTADDLNALSKALHDRGMYLMVDVVANHMGYAGSPDSVDYSVFNPFNSQDYFHSYCPITDYNDPTIVEQCWMGDDTVCLPDLNTESSDVQDIWYSWIGDLVSNYSVDGLRIDTVAEVDKDFWTGYQEAAGVFAVGEVDNGDTSFVCPFQGPLNGVLNYPVYFPLVRAFQSTDGSMSDLADMINTVKSACSDSNLLGSFSENHDNPRFASYTDDIALAKNILTYTILADGIPIIYAGQEQHYSGGNDPNNREATWLSGYNTDSELYKWVAKMNKIRSFAISSDKGYTTYQNYPIYQDDNNLAMRKGSNGTQVITVVSNVGADGGEYTLTVTGAGFDSGTQLTELVTCTEVTVGDSGDISVPMSGGLPTILYPASKLNGTGSPCAE